METSVLLDYLPAIYQDSNPMADGSESPSFLGDYLLAFEKVLLGRNDNVQVETGSLPVLSDGPGTSSQWQGLEEKVANLHLLFSASHTPPEFLDWLAGWAGLIFRWELNEQQRRTLIANMFPLFRIRGTKRCLERLLSLFLGGKPAVDDHAYPGLQIGRYSELGRNTYLGGTSPHFFRVRLIVPLGDEAQVAARRRMAEELIEQAKPAHTYYSLELVSTRLQLGVHSRIGSDMFLG